MARWNLLNSTNTRFCLSGLLPQEMRENCCLFRANFAETVCIRSVTLIPVAACFRSPQTKSSPSLDRNAYPNNSVRTPSITCFKHLLSANLHSQT